MSESGVVSVAGVLQGSSRPTAESSLWSSSLGCVAAGGHQNRTLPPKNPLEKANLSKCENVGWIILGQHQPVTLLSVPPGEMKRRGCGLHGAG